MLKCDYNISFSLFTQGYKLNVYDISSDACTAMKAKGAQVFDSTQELAKNSKFVLTMLPNNTIVQKTYEEMIKDGVNKETLFVDSSTVDPNISKYVQKIVSGAGARFVDAPVSGERSSFLVRRVNGMSTNLMRKLFVFSISTTTIRRLLGGVMGAQNATLTFMVGGTTEEYDGVKEFLGGLYCVVCSVDIFIELRANAKGV